MTVRAALLAIVAVLAATAAPASAEPPRIDYALSGPGGDNGWFRGPVTIKWSVTGETWSSGCDTFTFTADTTGVTRTCTASFNDETASVTTRGIRIDQTPPSDVRALAARPPDAGAWYTAPLPITWSGADGMSGIAACTVLAYAGPDTASAAPAGTCRDKAGNESAPLPFALAYDATPPALAGVTAAASPGQATLRWAAGPDVARVTVTRQPRGGAAKVLADGPPPAAALLDKGLVDGKAYTWTVTAHDAAGNVSTATATAIPGALSWRARKGASYYNIQLLRGGGKVLSSWPSQPRYTVPSSWRRGGQRGRLVAGTYRWYVWPGYGPRAERRYGRVLAHGTFTVM